MITINEVVNIQLVDNAVSPFEGLSVQLRLPGQNLSNELGKLTTTNQFSQSEYEFSQSAQII